MNLKEELKKHIPDELYLKYRFKKELGYPLDLKNPRTFNEKLQWMKLNLRAPIFTAMVDKYTVKDIVSKRIGSEYIVKNYGVWDSFDDIDFSNLPDRFVLKCTHDSGGLVICDDKSKLDIKKAREKIEKSLKRDYYYCSREWPYKNVKPRIIAEELLPGQPNDYKLFCFNGEARLILVCSDRFEGSGLKEDFFDTNWNHMDIRRPKNGNSEKDIPRPMNLEKMLKIAEKLASGLPFVRVDFYEIEGSLLFGETTFFPAGGFEAFEPAKWDRIMGDWIDLSNKKASK